MNAYARQLKQLLPRGALWKLEPGSWLSKLLLGIAEEFARVDARGQVLLGEADPGTALETLEDWERVLAVAPATTEAERQVAVAAKFTARGGQTAAYFVGLAESLGFVATVTRVAPYVWRLDVDLVASSAAYGVRTQVFRAGSGRAGEHLASWTVPELEIEINRAKPAHTLALFAYHQ